MAKKKAKSSRKHQGAPTLRASGESVDRNRWWMDLLQLSGLALLTYLLSLPVFAPTALAPLAYVFWVPWAVGICLTNRAGLAYLVSYLLGAIWFLTHMRWMYITTGPGYIAGSLYLGTHFILMAWPLRYLVRVRGWSLTWALPVCVVGLEMFRSLGPLGFPWFLIGHTQIRFLPMIQIADLAGAYGVSFVVVMVNGLLAHLIVARTREQAQPQPQRAFLARHVHTVIAAMVLLAALGYGQFRLSQSTLEPGPTVAVIQGDYALSTEYDPDGPTWSDKKKFYFEQMRRAASDHPDLIVLPETPWDRLFLNSNLHALLQDSEWQSRFETERLDRYLYWATWGSVQHRELQEFAHEHDTHVVIGSLSILPQDEGKYPDEYKHNSAFVFYPDGRATGRYDKVHLVIFGEYVPFRYSPSFHWLYRWLNSVTPWGGGGYEYSLEHGKEFQTFALAEEPASTQPVESSTTRPVEREGDRTPRFGVTICYEDVMPQVFRRFVAGEDGRKRVEFMLNISNDGWFGQGSQQAQHLVACAFRAVENRVGVARAVNTGISGFIDPTGRWRDLVPDADGPLRAGGSGYSVAQVMIDPRLTVYSRIGDVFGFVCLAIWAFSMIPTYLWGRRQRRQRRHRQESST